MALYDLGYQWGGGQSLSDAHLKFYGRDTYYTIYSGHTVRYGGIRSDRLPFYEVDEFLQEFCGLVDEEDLNIESLL